MSKKTKIADYNDFVKFLQNEKDISDQTSCYLNAAGLAHDFNNILTTISGYSEMLLDDHPGDSPLAEIVSRIAASVNKAKSITDQLLRLNRQSVHEKTNIVVSEILKETLEFVRSSLPSNIAINCTFPVENIYIQADKDQLFRVFYNLFTNAIQVLADKGGTISVTLEVLGKKLIQHKLSEDVVSDEYLLITFNDTGKGIEPSYLGRIFEPFFTSSGAKNATGLGLFIVREIITGLKGEVFVSSEMHKGTCFYIYLPVADMPADSSLKGNGN